MSTAVLPEVPMPESWKQTAFICVYLTALILLVAMEQRQYIAARLESLPGMGGGANRTAQQTDWSLAQAPVTAGSAGSYDTSSMEFPPGTWDGTLSESPLRAMLVEIAVANGRNPVDVPTVQALTEELIERHLLPEEGGLSAVLSVADAEQLSIDDKRKLASAVASYLSRASGITSSPGKGAP